MTNNLIKLNTTLDEDLRGLFDSADLGYLEREVIEQKIDQLEQSVFDEACDISLTFWADRERVILNNLQDIVFRLKDENKLSKDAEHALKSFIKNEKESCLETATDILKDSRGVG